MGMRVLVVTIASRSHFYPLVPLAWALAAAGHEVRVAHPPALANVVAEAGLASVPAGPAGDLDLAWKAKEMAPVAAAAPKAVHSESRYAVAMFTAVAEAMADDVLAHALAWRPDVIMYEPRAYAGCLAAAVIGVPSVRHLWGTDYTLDRWDLERSTVEPFFARYGVNDVNPLGDLTVDPCPPSLQFAYAPNRTVTRYLTYNGAGPVGRPLPPVGERPRVCVTWGTTTARIVGHLHPVRGVVQALSTLDVEPVVAVLGAQRDLLGELPSRVRVVEDVPLNAILPSCAAVVHQGGSGTTITSALSGTPQLVVPAVADQFLHAERVAALELGRRVLQGDATADAIASAVDDLLADPKYRRNAKALSVAAEEPPAPSTVVSQIAALAVA
jgi:UDP:flavonoid glycosyltransferase YjiC (YdhE family)